MKIETMHPSVCDATHFGELLMSVMERGTLKHFWENTSARAAISFKKVIK